MRLRIPEQRRSEDHLIPLINIVFLILIFFLIASALQPFSDREIKLAESAIPSNAAASPRMIIIRSDGTRFIGRQPLTDSALQACLKIWSKESDLPITLVADHATKAKELITVATLVRAAGIKNVKLLTRRVR